MRESGVLRAIVLGALAALLLVLGATVYIAQTRSQAAPRGSNGVVLVVESVGEDGSTGSELIAIVSGGGLRDVDPDASMTVPGTSGTRLRDAYTFGGAAGLASALSTGGGTGTLAYVTVPQSVWGPAVDKSGGVRVSVPVDMNVFDGRTMTTFRAGDQTIRAAALSALLRGLPYVDAARRFALRETLSRGIAASLASAGVPASTVKSDMPDDELRTWLAETLSASAKR